MNKFFAVFLTLCILNQSYSTLLEKKVNSRRNLIGDLHPKHKRLSEDGSLHLKIEGRGYFQFRLRVEPTDASEDFSQNGDDSYDGAYANGDPLLISEIQPWNQTGDTQYTFHEYFTGISVTMVRQNEKTGDEVDGKLDEVPTIFQKIVIEQNPYTLRNGENQRCPPSIVGEHMIGRVDGKLHGKSVTDADKSTLKIYLSGAPTVASGPVDVQEGRKTNDPVNFPCGNGNRFDRNCWQTNPDVPCIKNDGSGVCLDLQPVLTTKCPEGTVLDASCPKEECPTDSTEHSDCENDSDGVCKKMTGATTYTCVAKEKDTDKKCKRMEDTVNQGECVEEIDFWTEGQTDVSIYGARLADRDNETVPINCEDGTGSGNTRCQGITGGKRRIVSNMAFVENQYCTSGTHPKPFSELLEEDEQCLLVPISGGQKYNNISNPDSQNGFDMEPYVDNNKEPTHYYCRIKLEPAANNDAHVGSNEKAHAGYLDGMESEEDGDVIMLSQTIYGRDGSLHVNKYGYLVDDNGLLLVSDGTVRSSDPNARHHIHVPSRADNILVTPTGKVMAVELGGSSFIKIGQIKLARFENPQGLNIRLEMQSNCNAANEDGFALGNWCAGTELDGKMHTYYSETDVSGPGIVGNPGEQGFGRLIKIR